MKLTELNPKWVSGVPGRSGMGIRLLCPLCRSEFLVVWFSHPIDGGPPVHGQHLWDREGDTFDTLTLRPSVDASGPGQIPCTSPGLATWEDIRAKAYHWHGFITNGQIS